MSRNAGDPEQVKEASKKEKLDRDQELNDLRELLELGSGRRLVWRYISTCGVFRTSFGGGPEATAFNEGMRNVGLKLMDDVMAANPDAYALMQKEAKKREEPNA